MTRHWPARHQNRHLRLRPARSEPLALKTTRGSPALDATSPWKRKKDVEPDGTPGELFIKIAKEGSAISGMCQAFCRAFSIALQYGLPTEEAVKRFKGMRFEPNGMTSNPDIPEADSIVDYVAKYMELQFGKASRRG